MNDFNTTNLTEATNEYIARLVNILTPLIVDGVKSIFDEAWKLCKENGEESKYLMTFQNFLARVPKWSSVIAEEETKRIINKSGCAYLEDLLTCVHIIQLKIMTSIRVGQKPKKIDIDVPKLADFVHRVYIEVARKVYSNVYLFDNTAASLTVQKNMRELELIIRECVVNVVRSSVPVEKILRAYMDDTEETVESEEVLEEKLVTEAGEEVKLEEPKVEQVAGAIDNEMAAVSAMSALPLAGGAMDLSSLDLDLPVQKETKFVDKDLVMDMGTKKVDVVDAPKDLTTLEKISEERNATRKLMEEEDEDDAPKLRILDETPVDIGVMSLDAPKPRLDEPVELDINSLF